MATVKIVISYLLCRSYLSPSLWLIHIIYQKKKGGFQFQREIAELAKISRGALRVITSSLFANVHGCGWAVWL